MQEERRTPLGKSGPRTSRRHTAARRWSRWFTTTPQPQPVHTRTQENTHEEEHPQDFVAIGAHTRKSKQKERGFAGFEPDLNWQGLHPEGGGQRPSQCPAFDTRPVLYRSTHDPAGHSLVWMRYGVNMYTISIQHPYNINTVYHMNLGCINPTTYHILHIVAHSKDGRIYIVFILYTNHILLKSWLY